MMGSTRRRRRLVTLLAGALAAAATLAFAPTAGAADPHFTADNAHSGLCLSVAGNSNANNVAIVQYSCGAGYQVWRWGGSLSDGSSQMINVASGKCLGVAGGSQTSGAHVVQYTCNGNLDQYWLGYSPLFGGPSNRWQWVNHHSGLTLGVAGGSQANNAQVVQSTEYGGHNDQLWDFYIAS